MTITIEITGTKSEVESYFGKKIKSRNYREEFENVLSKKLKTEIEFVSLQMQSSMCFQDKPRYKLYFQRLGACELPKKRIKKRKK